MDTPVLHALWCHFTETTNFTDEDGMQTKNLCVVERYCLTIFGPSGAMFFVPLPFEVSCVFSLHTGLLVVRKKSPGFPIVGLTSVPGQNVTLLSKKEESRNCNTSVLDVDFTEAPLIFSLLHQLQELKPVMYAPLFCKNPSNENHASPSRFAVSDNEKEYENREILFSINHSDMTMLVMYDHVSKLNYICTATKIINSTSAHTTNELNETTTNLTDPLLLESKCLFPEIEITTVWPTELLHLSMPPQLPVTNAFFSANANRLVLNLYHPDTYLVEALHVINTAQGILITPAFTIAAQSAVPVHSLTHTRCPVPSPYPFFQLSKNSGLSNIYKYMCKCVCVFRISYVYLFFLPGFDPCLAVAGFPTNTNSDYPHLPPPHYPSEMVILGVDGDVALYTGPHRLVGVTLGPEHPPPVSVSGVPGWKGTISNLSNGCSNRFTAHFSDGTVGRFMLSCAPESTPLYFCIEGLAAMANDAITRSKKTETWRTERTCSCSMAHTILLTLRRMYIGAPLLADHDSEWQLFTSAVLSFSRSRPHARPNVANTCPDYPGSDTHLPRNTTEVPRPVLKTANESTSPPEIKIASDVDWDFLLSSTRPDVLRSSSMLFPPATPMRYTDQLAAEPCAQVVIMAPSHMATRIIISRVLYY